MNYELIKVEKRNHLTIITLNRPEVRNCINPIISAELDHAFDVFQEDVDAWVVILTGAGDKAFSAGNDLKFDALTPPEEALELRKKVKYGFAGITKNYNLDKPVIAAVNGFALGGGFEIALACDIILAADVATFSFPEPMVGRIPIGGGVQRLPRHIPYHLAMELLLTRRRITAEEAMSYGIVCRVVPQADLMATAEEMAEEIMLGSPLANRAIKQTVNQGLEMTLQEANQAVTPLYKRFVASEDFVEGPRAFTEKRKPKWTGK
ncbi:MAG: enoyl-CoA hydratase [Proteobacteria bacterium]|nr:enoyl-CoA hydratase [Pseudomonadota bacterium]